MESRFRRFRWLKRHAAFFLAVVFVVGLCLTDADAQRRRRRRVRTAPRPVITNPDIAPPGSESTGPDGERIISTADETQPEPEPATATIGDKQRKTTPAGPRTTQQKLDALAAQIDRLEKLNEEKDRERASLELDRLTRAEQRGESLRIQLMDVETKLADLQPRLDEVLYALKPENIERSAAGVGTMRPEELRDTRRRQLESSKTGLQRQISILEASRVRLEAAISTADAEVDRLRRRLEAREMQDPAPTASEVRPPENPAPPR